MTLFIRRTISMNHISIHVFILAWIISATTLCAQDDSSSSSVESWGPNIDGVRSRIWAEKTTYTVGDLIYLKYKLENRSKGVVDITTNRSHRGFLKLNIFRVKTSLDLNGEKSIKKLPVPLTEYGKALFQIRPIASPGAHVVQPNLFLTSDLSGMPINQVYDMTIAGDYEISISRQTNCINKLVIETNTLQIKMLERERRKISSEVNLIDGIKE
tara:strand:+ start:4170 stop:4811 length:642 start_codon:yes stop_codon:yes gene_type:complete